MVLFFVLLVQIVKSNNLPTTNIASATSEQTTHITALHQRESTCNAEKRNRHCEADGLSC